MKISFWPGKNSEPHSTFDLKGVLKIGLGNQFNWLPWSLGWRLSFNTSKLFILKDDESFVTNSFGDRYGDTLKKGRYKNPDNMTFWCL